MRSPALVGVVLVATLVGLVAPAMAEIEIDDSELPASADLEEARDRMARIETRLATEAGDLEGLEERVYAAEAEVAELDRHERELRDELGAIEARIDARMRLAFMGGDTGAIELLLTGQDASEVSDRAMLLESLALRDRAEAEDADAVRAALSATLERREEQLATLDVLRADLQVKVDRLITDLEQVQQDEQRFAEELERQREEERARQEEELRRKREEEERRRRAAEIRQQQAADPGASGSGSSGGSSSDDDGGGDESSSDPAPTSGGYACPVGDPVVFTDTWGAPRSGGRRHQGVDMMSPHGTPIYAITSGQITRMNSSGLGGISIYMYGDDGNQYYYTHLQGYAGGISVGTRVGAGTLIAYNGSSGNASASAPHLHFEVHPGGGGAVNPYPWAAMACGR